MIHRAIQFLHQGWVLLVVWCFVVHVSTVASQGIYVFPVVHVTCRGGGTSVRIGNANPVDIAATIRDSKRSVDASPFLWSCVSSAGPCPTPLAQSVRHMIYPAGAAPGVYNISLSYQGGAYISNTLQITIVAGALPAVSMYFFRPSAALPPLAALSSSASLHASALSDELAGQVRELRWEVNSRRVSDKDQRGMQSAVALAVEAFNVTDMPSLERGEFILNDVRVTAVTSVDPLLYAQTTAAVVLLPPLSISVDVVSSTHVAMIDTIDINVTTPLSAAALQRLRAEYVVYYTDADGLDHSLRVIRTDSDGVSVMAPLVAQHVTASNASAVSLNLTIALLIDGAPVANTSVAVVVAMPSVSLDEVIDSLTNQSLTVSDVDSGEALELAEFISVVLSAVSNPTTATTRLAWGLRRMLSNQTFAADVTALDTYQQQTLFRALRASHWHPLLAVDSEHYLSVAKQFIESALGHNATVDKPLGSVMLSVVGTLVDSPMSNHTARLAVWIARAAGHHPALALGEALALATESDAVISVHVQKVVGKTMRARSHDGVLIDIGVDPVRFATVALVRFQRNPYPIQDASVVPAAPGVLVVDVALSSSQEVTEKVRYLRLEVPTDQLSGNCRAYNESLRTWTQSNIAMTASYQGLVECSASQPGAFMVSQPLSGSCSDPCFKNLCVGSCAALQKYLRLGNVTTSFVGVGSGSGTVDPRSGFAGAAAAAYELQTTANRCCATTTTSLPRYDWSVKDAGNGRVVLAQRGSRLYVPPRTIVLQPGNNYTLALTVTATRRDVSGIVFDRATMTWPLRIAAPPPVVSITSTLGAFVRRGTNDTIVIPSSIDDVVYYVDSSPFEWSCVVVRGDAACPSLSDASVHRLVIPSGGAAVGEYDITLTYRRTVVSAPLRLQVVDDKHVPVVRIVVSAPSVASLRDAPLYLSNTPLHFVVAITGRLNDTLNISWFVNDREVVSAANSRSLAVNGTQFNTTSVQSLGEQSSTSVVEVNAVRVRATSVNDSTIYGEGVIHIAVLEALSLSPLQVTSESSTPVALTDVMDFATAAAPPLASMPSWLPTEVVIGVVDGGDFRELRTTSTDVAGQQRYSAVAPLTSALTDRSVVIFKVILLIAGLEAASSTADAEVFLPDFSLLVEEQRAAAASASDPQTAAGLAYTLRVILTSTRATSDSLADVARAAHYMVSTVILGTGGTSALSGRQLGEVLDLLAAVAKSSNPSELSLVRDTTKQLLSLALASNSPLSAAQGQAALNAVASLSAGDMPLFVASLSGLLAHSAALILGSSRSIANSALSITVVRHVAANLGAVSVTAGSSSSAFSLTLPAAAQLPGLAAEDIVGLAAVSYTSNPYPFASDSLLSSVVSFELSSGPANVLRVSGMDPPLSVALGPVARDNAACKFWDTRSGAWSTVGVSTELKDVGGVAHMVCRTTHLTAFAQLPAAPADEGFDPLSMVNVVIGVGILLAVVVLAIIFCVHRQSRLNNANEKRDAAKEPVSGEGERQVIASDEGCAREVPERTQVREEAPPSFDRRKDHVTIITVAAAASGANKSSQQQQQPRVPIDPPTRVVDTSVTPRALLEQLCENDEESDMRRDGNPSHSGASTPPSEQRAEHAVATSCCVEVDQPEREVLTSERIAEVRGLASQQILPPLTSAVIIGTALSME